MNRKVLLPIFVAFAVILLTGLGSAYYGDYNYKDYHSTTSKGYYGGPSYTKTVDYTKSTDKVYLPYGGYETRTHYTKVVRETPDYYSGYGGSYYAGYRFSSRAPYSYYNYGPDRAYGNYYYKPVSYNSIYGWSY